MPGPPSPPAPRPGERTAPPWHLTKRARARRIRLRRLTVLAAVVTVGVVAVLVATSSSGANHRSASPTTTARRPAGRRTTKRSSRKGTTATATPPTTDGPTGVLAGQAVTSYLAGRTGDITAAVLNLDNGQTSVWRPGVSEYTASIVKVDILETLLQQGQTANQPLSADQEDLATSMIEESDDDSATDLWDDIGEGSAMGTYNALLHLGGTQPGSGPYWGGTQTTASDQVTLLQTVVQANATLSDTSRNYELSLMEHVDPSQAWGVSSGVPSGVTLAIKNGWLPLEDDGDWQVNSIGWVDGDGRDYLIAVLTKDNDTEGYGIDTIEGLSQLVWSGLASTS